MGERDRTASCVAVGESTVREDDGSAGGDVGRRSGVGDSDRTRER